MKAAITIALSIALIIYAFASCVHKPNDVTPADGNYPPEVAKIIITKCAISGCHNAASYAGADSLLLDSWDHMFDGCTNGAVVVPFSPQYSSLMYFINTDSALGPIVGPTMPYSQPNRPMAPLTKDEYMTLYNWIDKGAPDKYGNIPFASDPDTRQKIYLTNQGCDQAAVIDAKRMVVMRYISIGADPSNIESPHCIRMSDDGMRAYTSFLAGNYLQKIDTRTDQVVSQADIGAVHSGGSGGSWNICFPSPGVDSEVLVTDWEPDGIVATVNTANMTVPQNRVYQGSGLFIYPHGIACNPAFDTFFITAQYGNIVYKFSPFNGYYKQVSINGLPPSASPSDSGNTSSPNPHEILMSPDYSKYFLTCQSTKEVRVMDAHSDNVIAAISVGEFPQEMAISRTEPYLFVTCMEDAATPVSGAKGSVYVINYNTLSVVQVLYGDFYQPHGITVDDRDGLVFIASTNANPTGPAPHHATSCGGRAGWYTVYNLHTLQPVNHRRYEVTVMPYSAATRFKQ